MTTMKNAAIFWMACVCVVAFGRAAYAHCDTTNGPVVSAARDALQSNDVTGVLKWVKEPQESEVREAFRRTMAVRGTNAAVQELADRFFFETVVRLHRLGEGEPYTGLKDGSDVDEAIHLADVALEKGDVDPLVKLATERAATEIRERFARVRALQRAAGESVLAGRRYVDAYVQYIHLVEALNGKHE